MGNVCAPKHKVLREFTKILYQLNPMGLDKKNKLVSRDEYEVEALSILSRFTEGALHLCVDDETRLDLANNIVKGTFDFWFSIQNLPHLAHVARVLIQAYVAAFPQPEQIEASVVGSPS
jgi:hypothetical protein